MLVMQGAANGNPDDQQEQMLPDESGRGLQETTRSSLIVSAFNSSVVFWLQTFFAPGLQVWPCAITWFLFKEGCT